MAINRQQPVPYHGSLGALLDPRGQLRWFAGALSVGGLLGWFSLTRLNTPLWAAVVLVIATLIYPAARKWQRDQQRWGTPAMVLSVLVATQAFHTVEHVTQWIQYHVLGWPLKASSGLISPLNAEIVHFSWNVAVLVVVIYLLGAGIRNRWMWLLLVWATAHTAEHTYLFINYLAAVQRLSIAGAPLGAAQGLPGILGKNGWLATNIATTDVGTWLCTVTPGLMKAPRLDVHFWWNVGEIALLLPAAHVGMRSIDRTVAQHRHRLP